MVSQTIEGDPIIDCYKSISWKRKTDVILINFCCLFNYNSFYYQSINIKKIVLHDSPFER